MMILPVPNPASVQFEDGTMHYKTLFKDAAESFFVVGSQPQFATRGVSKEKETLPILAVGSYQASIAHTVEDLESLDATVFNITPELIEMLKKTYENREIGFICCVLKPGANIYEPIAYTHELGPSEFLFVPTKHYHMEVGPSSLYHGPMNALRATAEYADDWDHEIYSVATNPSLAHSVGDQIFLPNLPNRINWGQFPPEYQYGPGARLCRWAKKGRFDNVDLEFARA